MKNITTFLFFLTTILNSSAQKDNYPGEFEIRTYKIGEKVDINLFQKHDDLYFPNYLNGWNIENVDKLPDKYKGLPIAIWQSKKDSSIVLTLLNDKIQNITVSYMKEDEMEKLSQVLIKKFGNEGKQNSYIQTHPLQSWITYWNLKTWETKEVIFQIGNSDMRKAEDPIPTDMRWNLVYSDFILKKKIIDDYKKK